MPTPSVCLAAAPARKPRESSRSARSIAANPPGCGNCGGQGSQAESKRSNGHNGPERNIWADESCVLEPEVTQGPYYVSGEFVRKDVRETQQGVDLYADLQIIDVNTCELVQNLYVDSWHCNATGVYSGIIASGNGDSSDTTNLEETFLRGLYPTDEGGFVSFTTVFPATTLHELHIHVLGTYNGSLLENNTYVGGFASHVGLLFFDQDLISQVEQTSPYSSNKQEVTKNAVDTNIAEEAEGFDPVMEYTLLGENILDGMLAWIKIEVDMKRAQTITPAGKYTSNGVILTDSTSIGASGASGGSFGGAMGSAPGPLIGTGSFIGSMTAGSLGGGDKPLDDVAPNGSSTTESPTTTQQNVGIGSGSLTTAPASIVTHTWCLISAMRW